MLRGFQWDLARQVERLDWLLGQLPKYADWGYNELYLHLEDAVEFPSVAGVARADAYSQRELGRLVSAADKLGIKTVPIVNLLGHTQYLIKVPALRDLNELRAPDGTPLATGQICPVHPKTLQLARTLIEDMTPFCTAGKVHVGLDESFHLGKHPRSRREIARIGLPAHFARYVSRLNGIAHDLDLKLGIWADMLYFLPEAIPLLPADIAAYEWYYYGFSRRPRVELYNFRESDVGERLVARGIEYWGCPMNGAFRYEPMPHFRDRLENILSWWRRCHRLNAAGMLVTSWEPYRLAVELTTVVDAAAASLWLDGIAEPAAMLERGFARVFGRTTVACSRPPQRPEDRGLRTPATPIPVRPYLGTYSKAERARARAAARAALACDRYPFSGYPRWEINQRWDVVSRRESIASYRAEERWFRALKKAGRAGGVSLPASLKASIELRWYLAFRDVWVRRATRGRLGAAGEFRAAARIALRAARAMWRQTRSGTRSPNGAIVAADLQRQRAARRGKPVFGTDVQFCYRVENIAPAAQLVVVEQLQTDGTWRVIQSCHTIEFQGVAARPRGGLSREHAAPIEISAGSAVILRMRVANGGIVRLRDLALVSKRATVRLRKNTIVGSASPKHGLPKAPQRARALVIELVPRPAAGSVTPRRS